MKKWVGLILLAALVVVVVNDGGRHLKAVYQADEVSRELMAKAIQGSQAPGAGSPFPVVEALAREKGVEITKYDQQPDGLTIGVRVWVYGTWVTGPVQAYLKKVPRSTPYPVEATVRSTP